MLDQEIPLYPSFTMNGVIPISRTNTPIQLPTAAFTPEQIDLFIKMANSKKTQFPTDTYLYQALDKFPVQGKQVTLLHSTSPWYESILLAQGASPTTLSSPPCTDPRIQLTTSTEKADAVFSLLHLKSKGFGSNINPNADLEEMNLAKSLLKPEGLLYLSIPVGKDRIVWNSHRVYGELRMKTLFKGWRPAAYFGYSYEDLLQEPLHLHEPVIILKPV